MAPTKFRALGAATSCIFALSLAACGGSGDGNGIDNLGGGAGGGGAGGGGGGGGTPVTQTGIFLDSPVANIGYRTETLEGVTNALGEFDYLPGETVTFFIGDLELPPTPATGIVTPLNLVGTTDVTDQEVVNIIRLLQTLDEDGNPDNGITITEAAKQAATRVEFDQSVADFAESSAVSTLIMNAGQVEPVVALIDVEEAIANFEDQLDEIVSNLPVSGNAEVVGTWVADDGQNDLLAIVFFDDGTYVHVEYEPGNNNEESGMEWGNYARDAETGRVTATQIFDRNGDTGLTDFVAGDVAPFIYFNVVEGVGIASIDENGDNLIDDTILFGLQPNDGIVGTWVSDSTENELLLLSFSADGSYVHAEVDTDSDVEPDGMEFGTYFFVGDSSWVIATQTFDPNGGIGLTDFSGEGAPYLYIDVSGNTLTVTIDEDGDQQIDDTIVFDRAFPIPAEELF